MSAADPLRAFLERRVAAGRTPGAVYYVATPTGSLCGAVGRAGHAPATIDTPYDLASLTKVLCTAPLLGLLEAEGKWALDDAASRHLPELVGGPWEATTFAELSTHSSGLPAWRPLSAVAGDRDGYLREIAREPAAVARGTTVYSDLGFLLLGFAIERALDADLREIFAERIARPSGLDRLGFPGPAATFADAAPTEEGNAYERRLAGEIHAAHDWREHIPPGQVHDANAHRLGGVAGHAGLFGSVTDVVRLVTSLCASDDWPFTPSFRRRWIREVVGGSGRGIGWELASASRAACGILPAGAPGHTGFTGTSVWCEPIARRTYVLLSNRVCPRVDPRGFQTVRRGFHRLARSLSP